MRDSDGPASMSQEIVYRPIGIVHSPFTEQEGTPIQPSRAGHAIGTVEVYPEFVEGLADLDGFSHIILLCHLHASSGYRLKVVPFLDTRLRGLFATRAPKRPNPIGLSIVKLVAIQDGILSIEGLDLLDHTPVLDIKPFVGEFDHVVDARFGWLEAARRRTDIADDRFR